MRRPARFWLTFVGAFAATFTAVDVWANFNEEPGDTASEQIRALGLPDWLLAVSLSGAAAGLYVHLKRRPHERASLAAQPATSAVGCSRR